MESKAIKRLTYLVLAFASLLFYSCGGGGGGTAPAASTVSGVAAAGAPLVGQVSLVDATGKTASGSPKTLGSDGSFSFNVSGMTAPYFLQAQGTVGGTEFTMYSVALGAGTANINPMSSIAVAAMAGVNDPATVYSAPGTYASKMTQTAMNTAVTNMQSLMGNVLSPYSAGSANPITGSYTANHTGIDAAFDVSGMNINTTNGTVTVVDKTSGTSGSTIGTATLAQMMGSTPPAAVPAVSNPTLPTDLQGINAMLTSMGTALNKGANLTTNDLAPFFAADPGFGINNGMTRTQVMGMIQSGISLFLGGRTISQMSNVTFNGNKGGGYIISFEMHMSDGSMIMSNMTFSDEFVMAKNASGAWQITGNRHQSLMENTMLNQQWLTTGATQTEAGMHFDMEDPANVFKSAVITGAGLPAGGVEMIKESLNQTIFMLATPSTLPSKSDKFFTMTDTAIASIPDNAPFTFSFYSSLPPRNNPMEQRTMTIPKRCLTRTEAAAATGVFPTVTPSGNLATHTFSSMMGNMMGGMMGGMMSMPFTYTTPTGLPVTMMTSKFDISSSTFSNEVTQGIPLNGTSSTMQMQGPTGTAPTSGTGSIDVRA
jgi:hypothetical protein